MKIKAYAKINLSIAVFDKRDDGYHEIDSLMQSISLHDLLEIKPDKNITVKCSDESLSGEGNIAYKAAELFFESCNIAGGADIYIEKNIPSPAGLGGGSSDAAAVLVALNKLYNAGLSNDELCDIAVRLGADVPFFIRGGLQRARGIGEVLEPIDARINTHIVIALNGIKPSTGVMYSLLDSAEHEMPDIERAISAAVLGDKNMLGAVCGNSFASVTGLYGIDDLLSDTNADYIGLSGSGPAVFALYGDIDDTAPACELLKSKKIEHYVAVPVNCGAEIE